MTLGKGLYFRKGINKNIEIFSDADLGWFYDRQKSHLWLLHFCIGNLVSWQSRKQSVVTRSSVEVEFRAMVHVICEGMWLKRLLEELKIPTKRTMKMFCDNQATISIAKNTVHHDRTKHVEINCHFIKEKFEEGLIKMLYTPTSLQTAGILTKALPKTSFEALINKLGMIDIYGPA